MTIDAIREHTSFLAQCAEASAKVAAANPENHLLQIIAKNQLDAKNESINELARLEEEISGQHLAVRLQGPKADGSIRLDEFIRIFEPFVEAVKKATSLAMYGSSSLRMKSDTKMKLDIMSNIKLRSLSFGSTEVHFSVPTIEDSTGEAPMIDVLKNTFNLLNETENEEFLNKIESIGGDAAKALRSTLAAIQNSGFTATIVWNSPEGSTTWDGTSANIIRAYDWLGSLTQSQEYEEQITGKVASLKDTGLIEVRDEANQKISVRYPLSLITEIQKLSVGLNAQFFVITKKSWDEGGKRWVFSRRLLSCQRI
tara:strand:+ start:866 stop:1801 length:936 start_codon:yes stop_codon:yes gene_type:complete